MNLLCLLTFFPPFILSFVILQALEILFVSFFGLVKHLNSYFPLSPFGNLQYVFCRLQTIHPYLKSDLIFIALLLLLSLENHSLNLVLSKDLF